MRKKRGEGWGKCGVWENRKEFLGWVENFSKLHNDANPVTPEVIVWVTTSGHLPKTALSPGEASERLLNQDRLLTATPKRQSGNTGQGKLLWELSKISEIYVTFHFSWFSFL